MTFREKLLEDHPACVDPRFYGGCDRCPDSYGYEPRRAGCPREIGKISWRKPRERCTACWNREYTGYGD